MHQTMLEIVMNPVRQRVIQYLAVHHTGTVGEMAIVLSDVPKPSLYRHLKILRDASLIQVVAEQTVRGAVERTYALARPQVSSDDKADEMGLAAQGTLLALVASFARYFAQPDADPVRDMLSISTSTLLLSDEEMTDLAQKLNALFMEVLNNEPRADRRYRHITFVSSPTNEEVSL